MPASPDQLEALRKTEREWREKISEEIERLSAGGHVSDEATFCDLAIRHRHLQVQIQEMQASSLQEQPGHGAERWRSLLTRNHTTGKKGPHYEL